jgi:sulfatase modifying factor 1
MRTCTLFLLLCACGDGERFSEQRLAAEEIPDDPSTWTVEANRPAMVPLEPGGMELASTEVSQGLYRAVTGRNPSMTVGYDKKRMVGERFPVQGVSFLDALRFCNALSEADGLEPAYAIEGGAVTWSPSAGGYRLPTEDEWERAARAGGEGPWSGAGEPVGVCAFANVADATLGRADGFVCADGHAGKAPVGSLEPNAWGLHDLTGNVWEWVWTEPTPEGERVYKGGSWLDGPEGARIEARRTGSAGEMSIQLGFRIARSVAAPG